MSRLFNMLSGAVAIRSEPPAPAKPAPAPAAEQVEESDEIPFIEIGGPTGPIFSGSAALKTVPKATIAAEPKPVAIPVEAPPREFPRLAETQRYVSVSFHTLAEPHRPATPIDGPDLGLVALHIPDHPISGEYRSLRDAIRAQLPEPLPRVIQFAAAAAEAGTTSVLLNLAVTLAREDAPRVLVVDANTARPALARMLAAKPAPGLMEVLAKQIPLPWAVQPTAVDHLEVLPVGAATAAAAEVFAEEFPRLVEQLRQWYDWVLVDAGVWAGTAEAVGPCAAADAVYLVTRADDASRPEFLALRNGVKTAGGLLRGFVSTRV